MIKFYIQNSGAVFAESHDLYELENLYDSYLDNVAQCCTMLQDQDNVFGEADLEPYCKFCFAKRWAFSIGIYVIQSRGGHSINLMLVKI